VEHFNKPPPLLNKRFEMVTLKTIHHLIGQQTRTLPDGTKIKIKTGPEP
jgi:hypothetical protein